MNIVHIIPSIDSSGGAERLVVQLASEMSEEHTVTIITYRDTPPSSTYIKELSENVKCISMGKKKGFDLTLSFRLFKTIRKIRPDIINAHLRASFLYIILSIIFYTKPKYVFTVHSIPSYEERRRWVFILRRLLIKLHKLYMVVLSNGSANEFYKYYGVRCSEVIPNGILSPVQTEKLEFVKNEIEQFKMTPKSKVFLTIGRIDKNKNQTMLAEIFNELADKGYDVVLLIIGEPRAYISGNKEFQHLLKYENVHFLGLRENIGDYLSCADAFCLGSYKEGLPLVILEALSYGLPIISTPAGGVSDVIVDGVNGFLVPDFEYNSFLLRIKEYLECNKSQIIEIGQNNRELFSNQYTIQSTCNNYINLYKRLIS